MELSYQSLVYEGILFTCLNLCLLTLWFHTNAFVEYAKILVILDKPLDIESYEKEASLTGISYPDYLQLNYNSFFTRLVSCPFCICSWLCVIELFFLKNGWMAIVLYFPCVFMFFLLSLIIKRLNDN